MKAFIPVDFLTEDEISLLDETKKRIENSNKKEDLKYYELVLDFLMKASYRRRGEQEQ